MIVFDLLQAFLGADRPEGFVFVQSQARAIKAHSPLGEENGNQRIVRFFVCKNPIEALSVGLLGSSVIRRQRSQ